MVESEYDNGNRARVGEIFIASERAFVYREVDLGEQKYLVFLSKIGKIREVTEAYKIIYGDAKKGYRAIEVSDRIMNLLDGKFGENPERDVIREIGKATKYPKGTNPWHTFEISSKRKRGRPRKNNISVDEFESPENIDNEN